MKTYEVAINDDPKALAFRERVRRERWVWTCNGLVLPYDEEEFRFRQGDVLSLLQKDRRSFRNNIPVMG